MHVHDTKLFINGEWRPALTGETIEVVNPATGSVIGTVARAAIEDLDLALSAADRSFSGWKVSSPLERAKIMQRAAQFLRERAGEISEVMSA